MTAGVVTPTEGSAAEVLSQATSGSVAQVAQLLSLSGTTLDLAATLLTVSVVDIESGGGSSATGGSGGPGQGSRQANGDTNDSADEPIAEENQESPAIAEWAPAWERLAIGLERSWERARSAVLELEGRLPKAEGIKATNPPAAPVHCAGTTRHQGSERGPGQTRPADRGRDGLFFATGGFFIHYAASGYRPGHRCRTGGHGSGSSSRWAGFGILGPSRPKPSIMI